MDLLVHVDSGLGRHDRLEPGPARLWLVAREKRKRSFRGGQRREPATALDGTDLGVQ